jgi:hypothetical protein
LISEGVRDPDDLAVGLPEFVRKEFEALLGCNALPKGFIRLRCDACKHERLHGFSSKTRTLCWLQSSGKTGAWRALGLSSGRPPSTGEIGGFSVHARAAVRIGLSYAPASKT